MTDAAATLTVGSGGESAGGSPARRPELLSPAGDWDCARAAVENGADGIYFGLEQFNARMRAHNFTEADLPPLMEYLHRRGVKGYVTFNTLVFPAELEQAERFLRSMIAAGVDAAIVQDVGMCRLIRRLSPDFPIHASTQMTLTSAAGVQFARELGCSVVVLAREVPVQEIARIREAMSGSSPAPVNGPEPRPAATAVPETQRSADLPAAAAEVTLEVFIHGALCVAYSGQCLTSESLGGRSANRGVCAQACRMPYELVSDGHAVELGDRRYLLSPQDLAGLEMLPDLVQAGIGSFKIEGRLKTPEYVANVTRVYRRALDEVWAALGGEAPDATRAARAAGQIAQETRYDLEMAFSRGLYTGWIRGVNNQELVHGRFGKKRGVFLGSVSQVREAEVQLLLEGPLKPGDGLVFDAGRPDLEEEGGRVYEIFPVRQGPSGPGQSILRFGRGDIDFRKIRVGDKVWKTSDPELDRRLRQSFEGDTPRQQRPVTMMVHGAPGGPLHLEARDERGHVVRVSSAVALAAAERRPLTPDTLREQLGRLGGTPFRLGSLEVRLEGQLMLPLSELNRLRRDAVQELETLRRRPLRWTLRGTDDGGQTTEGGSPDSGLRASVSGTTEPVLAVLVRNLAQLEAVLEAGQRLVYCDFEDPKQYRAAVERFRSGATATSPVPLGLAGPREIWIAPPRIFKMGEDWILGQVQSAAPDGYLVRNPDHLVHFAGSRRIGDFSLNIANRLAAEFFMARYGLERVTASYDLNPGELAGLLRSAPPDWFEITLHQHMPMFHMEHCLFCAFLSQGKDYRDCGRPCDRHELRLRDRVGAEHPVKVDAGCRNTVFNALAQTGAEAAAGFLALGARRFRLEFLNEPPDQVTETLRRYRDLLAGRITGASLWRELKLLNQLGVTRGSGFSPGKPAHELEGRAPASP